MVARGARGADRRIRRDPDPLGDQARRAADRPGRAFASGRPGRGGGRQRRRRRRHQSRDHRRQRAPVERDHGRRAHDGPAARARPQRAAGARLADRRRVGALEVLGRRAVREDARDPRLRQDRPARGRARAGVRNARDRVRPVRVRRALPRAAGREGRVLRRHLRRGGLHHAPPAEHARHPAAGSTPRRSPSARTACGY